MLWWLKQLNRQPRLPRGGELALVGRDQGCPRAERQGDVEAVVDGVLQGPQERARLVVRRSRVSSKHPRLDPRPARRLELPRVGRDERASLANREREIEAVVYRLSPGYSEVRAC